MSFFIFFCGGAVRIGFWQGLLGCVRSGVYPGSSSYSPILLFPVYDMFNTTKRRFIHRKKMKDFFYIYFFEKTSQTYGGREGFHSNLIEKTKIKRVQIKIKTTKNLHPQVRSLAEFQVEFCENPSCILFAALSID